MLRSFIGTLKVTVGEVSFGLDIEPVKGAADSGDLEIDLSNPCPSGGAEPRSLRAGGSCITSA